MKNKLPFVGIATAAYNSKFIGDLIKSLERQDYAGRFVHCIVDDGSDAQYQNELTSKHFDASSYDKTHIFTDEHYGHCSRPYNVAFKELIQLGCDYIWKLDSDDWIEPNGVTEMVKVIDQGYDWVCCSSQTFGEASVIIEPVANLTFDSNMNSNKLTSFAMFRASTWKRYGGFDESMEFEDWELWQRWLQMNRFNYAVLTNPVVHHYRLHPGNDSKKTGLRFEQNRQAIISKLK